MWAHDSGHRPLADTCSVASPDVWLGSMVAWMLDLPNPLSVAFLRAAQPCPASSLLPYSSLYAVTAWWGWGEKVQAVWLFQFCHLWRTITAPEPHRVAEAMSISSVDPFTPSLQEPIPRYISQQTVCKPIFEAESAPQGAWPHLYYNHQSAS